MTWMDGQDVHLAALFCPGCTGAILSAAEAKNIEFERFQRRIQSGSQKKELWMGCWMGLEGDGGLQESHIISSELYQDQFTVGLETSTLAPWKNEGGFVLCIGSRVTPESFAKVDCEPCGQSQSTSKCGKALLPRGWCTIPTWIHLMALVAVLHCRSTAWINGFVWKYGTSTSCSQWFIILFLPWIMEFIPVFQSKPMYITTRFSRKLWLADLRRTNWDQLRRCTNFLWGMYFKRRFMIDGFELPQQLVAREMGQFFSVAVYVSNPAIHADITGT